MAMAIDNNSSLVEPDISKTHEAMHLILTVYYMPASVYIVSCIQMMVGGTGIFHLLSEFPPDLLID